MKLLVTFSCIMALGLAKPTSPEEHAEWETYKKNFGKSYESLKMEALRKSIYFVHKEKVLAHNARYEQGLTTYFLGLNHLADLLPTESAKMLNGYKRTGPKSALLEVFDGVNATLPAAVDWRTKGAVTPIKNQGGCGSCWAFSTTGALEGQHKLKQGKLYSLSEQQLVDCSAAEGNLGCDGGLMDSGFQYIKKNGGILTEDSYPYTEENGKCHATKKNVVARVTGVVDVKQGSEAALQAAVATVGPISVAIDASSNDFQLYAGGVYNDKSCSNSIDDLDHGVLAVGYGVHKGKAYWLVKNSWGTNWGISGYIMMSRNENNQCGIATEASYPLV
uniref:Cathepsin L n=1 Tax=Lygus hesperus TaxID=30085 RepID=A0A0K8T4R1_LYGHE